MRSFRSFGGDHLLALGAIALACAGAAILARSRGRAWSGLLASIPPGAMVALMALDARAGLSWRSWAPLQLCDVAALISAVALVTRWQRAFELTYLWGGAGAIPALLTPDLAEGFPHWRFALYFAQHGGIVLAAAALLSAGMRPRRSAPLFALAALNAYAVLCGLVDAGSGANFMYLRHKPGAATVLDWLGGWPWYLLGCELVALAAFALLVALARERTRARPRAQAAP